VSGSRLARAALAALALLSVAASRPPRFSNLTNRDGLSQSSGQALAQDERGFLWIGTADGLNRYDGVEFKVYRPVPGDPASIAESNIGALAAAPGALWVGVNGVGLDRLDLATETFRHYRHDPRDRTSLGWVRVTHIAIGPDGGVWVAIEGHGIDRLDPATGLIRHFRHDPTRPDSLASDDVNDLAVGGGSVWAATANGLDLLEPTGAVRHLAKDPVYTRSAGAAAATALTLDRAGALWIGSGGPAVERIDPKSGALRRFEIPPDADRTPPNALVEDRDGILWAAMRPRGLLRIDPRTGEVVSVRHSETDDRSLPLDAVIRLLVDRAGDLWVGTWGGGVGRLDRRGSFVDTYGSSQSSITGLPRGDVRAIHEDRRGRILASVFRNGVIRIDPASRAAEPFCGGPGDADRWNEGNDMLPEGEALWLATDRGLKRVAEETGRAMPPAWLRTGHPLFTIRVHALARDRSGVLWLATSSGLARLDPVTGATRFYSNDPADPGSLPATPRLEHVLVDRKDRVWVAFKDYGLARLDRDTGRFHRYTHDPADAGSLADDDVQRIFEASDGALWLALEGGGVDRLDPETGAFRNYSMRDGLPNDVVYAALEDAGGHIWVSTNSGIARLDPRRGGVLRWDVRDGLQDQEFNYAAAALGASGVLYFGGALGINVIRPGDLQPDDDRPPVVLTSLSIRNRPAALARAAPYLTQLTLRHDQSFFTIAFASVGFRRADKALYTYRLEGVDQEPVVTSRRSASYTDVRPGRYRFVVSAQSGDGARSKSDGVLLLRVLAPWWATWWMRSLYALALLGAAAGIHQTRLALVTREKERLENRVGERTHQLVEKNVELQTTLERLRATQDQLVLSEKMASLGQLTAGIAHEIKNPLNLVNSFARLSIELAADLQAALSGSRERLDPEALEGIDEDLRDLTFNAGKVEEHGKRADEIVRAMLLHARGASDERQAADLNALVKDSVALAYHARRARDSSFQAAIEEVYDPSVGVVEVVPQEIARVVLNLVDNAFYAVQARWTDGGGAAAPTGHPTVSVTTARRDATVEVRVRDNGSGIPEAVVARIFEPFFTTKPAGQGTGLGLSLGYDIVERHGGTLRVESRQGSFTELVMTLPAPRH